MPWWYACTLLISFLSSSSVRAGELSGRAFQAQYPLRDTPGTRAIGVAFPADDEAPFRPGFGPRREARDDYPVSPPCW